MNAPWSLTILLVLVLVGCLREASPCPPGTSPDRVAGRCVAWGPDDAGETDAPSEDASLDAGVDAAPPACSANDLDAWRTIHLGDELVASIATCSASACTSTPCDVASCIGAAAGMVACDACVSAEADCATRRCANACTRATDAECRACLCEARCVDAFERCVGTELDVCADAHGRDARPEERVTSTPFVFRRKSTTGFTRDTAFHPDEPTRDDDRRSYAAIGFTDFVSFSEGGVDYLLEHLGGCPEARCPMRISPVLRDGSCGRPAYVDEWSRGFDVVTPLRIGGALHLFLYKSGRTLTELEPRGAGRVLRVASRADGALDVAVVYEGAWTPPVGPAWSHVRGFAVEDDTYLLQYRSGDSHAVEVTRVSREGDVLRFERVARELAWEADWDVVETFPVGERWFVLQYSRQRGGVAWISAWDHDARGEPTPTLPLSATVWSPTLTHVLPFRTPATTYLMRRDERSGEVDFLRLPADVTRWAREPGEVVSTRSWGTTPPWDVVTVARARLWEVP